MMKYLIPLSFLILAIQGCSSKILVYEFNLGEECYYTLEVDTAKRNSRFCAANCYEKTEYLEINCVAFKEFETYKYDKEERIESYPISYLFDTKKEKELQLYLEVLISDSNFFSFIYYIQDNWDRLEYEFYSKSDSCEITKYSHIDIALKKSSFLREHGITWIPSYMNRVKKIDYNRFPKKYRKQIKKGRLK